MSKMDGLRAMREARYAQAAARAAQGTTTPRAAAPRLAVVTSAPAGQASATADGEPAVEGLCGHRNMSGRTCTREHGHAAKSHRYS